MTVLAHVAGVPLEELLTPSLAYGATGFALVARAAWQGLRGRRRAARPSRRASRETA